MRYWEPLCLKQDPLLAMTFRVMFSGCGNPEWNQEPRHASGKLHPVVSGEKFEFWREELWSWDEVIAGERESVRERRRDKLVCTILRFFSSENILSLLLRWLFKSTVQWWRQRLSQPSWFVLFSPAWPTSWFDLGLLHLPLLTDVDAHLILSSRGKSPLHFWNRPN